MKIVFPEGIEPRIIGAAHRLQTEELVTPILLGNVEEISSNIALSSICNHRSLQLLIQQTTISLMKWLTPLLNVV